MTDTPARGSSTKIWNILKIFLALFLAGFIISKTDPDQLLALINRVSFFWIGLSVVLLVLLTMLKAYQYYVLVGGDVSYPQVLNVVVLLNAISNYFASSAGVVSYLAVLRGEHGVKLGRSVGMFVIVKIGDLIAIWLALVVSSVLVWDDIVMFRGIMFWLQAAIGLLVLVFLLVIFLRQRFVTLLEKFLHWSRLSRVPFIQKAMGTFQSLAEMATGRLTRILFIIFLLSITYFVVTIAYIYGGYRVFGFHQPFRDVLFVSTLLQLVSYIPVQIFGGLGVTETSALYFWSPFNVSQTELASVLIGMRIVAYLVNLLPLIYLPIYAIFLDSKNKSSE